MSPRALSASHTLLSARISASTRADVRREVFEWWLSEDPGDLVHRRTYRYDVEELADGSKIYLTPPTRLNKGADFIVYSENYLRFKNGNDRPPKQAEVVEELKALAKFSGAHAIELLTSIRRIWDCEHSEEVLADLRRFKGNLNAQRSLLLVKWLFIEQDVTYWTDSGRWMLREGIEREIGRFP